MSVYLEIDTCKQCPHLLLTREPSDDSFDYDYKWYCLNLKKDMRRYVSWADDTLYIDEECPMRRCEK